MTRLVTRACWIVLPCLVVLCAAMLRIEAISLRYGTVEHPRWLKAVQELTHAVVSPLKPRRLTWRPAPLLPHSDGKPTYYISDPYTNLAFAREMPSFYAAHFREPLFIFTTKIALGLLGDQDVAISFASALFSVLTVIATYLLGASAFSRWVGLGAALGMAIEYDVITQGIGGWRDDAFAFSVVAFAWALLRFSRAPSGRHAILLGVCAGLACLARITAVSFLVPGFALVLITTRPAWKERLAGLGLSVAVAVLVAGPYLVNCWRVYGDPLYAINYHTANFSPVAGAGPKPSAAAYARARIFAEPVRMLDNAVIGLTAHPFRNNFRGFERWTSGLGLWLSWAAIPGLVLFAGSAPGRLLLVVLLTSLLPILVTWTMAPDWRYTLHAYPFYLIASSLAVVEVVRLVGLVSPGRRQRARAVLRERAVFWVATLALIGLGLWIVLRILPVMRIQESIRINGSTAVVAGGRDGAFFGSGWSAPFTRGNITARASLGGRSVMWFPLPDASDYGITLRLDPYPRPIADDFMRPRTVRVLLNGAPLRDFPLRWNPGRVGAYDLELSGSMVRKGLNQITFVGDGDPDTTFMLWYLLVRPAAGRATAVTCPPAALDAMLTPVAAQPCRHRT